MQKEKTNTEHLRDLISKTLASNSENYDEINEFIDAIENEITNLNDENKSIQEEIDSKDSEIVDLQKELSEAEDYDFETIDCGIGIIEYVEPDNLQLQLLMQDFKEKQESVLFR